MFVASTPFERPLPTELGHRGNWICMNLLQQSRIDLQKKKLVAFWIEYGWHTMKFYPCSIQIFMHDLCSMPTPMSACRILGGWHDELQRPWFCDQFCWRIYSSVFTDEPIECLVKISFFSGNVWCCVCVCLLLSPACMTWWGVTGREWITSEDSFDSLKIM